MRATRTSSASSSPPRAATDPHGAVSRHPDGRAPTGLIAPEAALAP